METFGDYVGWDTKVSAKHVRVFSRDANSVYFWDLENHWLPCRLPASVFDHQYKRCGA